MVTEVDTGPCVYTLRISRTLGPLYGLEQPIQLFHLLSIQHGHGPSVGSDDWLVHPLQQRGPFGGDGTKHLTTVLGAARSGDEPLSFQPVQKPSDAWRLLHLAKLVMTEGSLERTERE